VDSSSGDKPVKKDNDTTTTTKNTTAQKQRFEQTPENDEGKDKEGPCGLPSKCVVS